MKTRGSKSEANLSNGAPSVRNQGVRVDPGSWDAFSDASTLNCRNRRCKDPRNKKVNTIKNNRLIL